MTKNQNLTIRFAQPNDINRISTFIHDNWNKNHIMAKSQEILKYYHFINKDFRFVLAEDTITQKIYGICGYIQSNENNKSDLWTVIWKTIKSPNIMLGLDIFNFIKNETGCRIISSCGINPATIPIYEFMNFYTGKLDHYYRLNDKINYNIAVVNNKILKKVENTNYKIITFDCFDELTKKFDFSKYKNRKPYKDKFYLKYRYFNHTIYKYKILGIKNTDDVINSILVGREICIHSTKILRLVDFIGIDSDLGQISYELDRLIQNNDYEYIDFYCHGIDKEIMKNSGMNLRTETDVNIIQNYYEPFEQKNVDIYYFTSDDDRFYMFKADGDQDRPSILTY